MTIIVHQHPLEETRTPSKSCKWLGEAIVNGRIYAATSRLAPANDIARQLVADGVPDTPMQIYSAGLKGCLTWPSFRLAALFTYEETATKQVRMVRWRDNAARMAQFTAASRDKQRVDKQRVDKQRVIATTRAPPSFVQSRWCSRSPLRLKAAHRVPGWTRLVWYRFRHRPEGLYMFFHRECRFAASHAAAETAEVPVGFPNPICHRPIRYRDRNTLVAVAPP
jgi:hypothetical protein